MNIFLLHVNAQQSAVWHCDKHCIKMILESTQLLYTAWWCCEHPFQWAPCEFEPYKQTHKNHPSAIWVRSSPVHYQWTLDLALNLSTEYTRRYGKVHKCHHHLKRLHQMGSPTPPTTIPPITAPQKIATTGCPEGCSYFLCAIADDVFESCKVITDGELNGVKTYQNYYKTKSFQLKWNKGGDSPPNWYDPH